MRRCARCWDSTDHALTYEGDAYCPRCYETKTANAREVAAALAGVSPVDADLREMEARLEARRAIREASARRIRWVATLFVLLEVGITCVLGLLLLPGPWVYLLWLVLGPCVLGFLAVLVVGAEDDTLRRY